MAEKSHVLSSTSWGPKKAGAVISVWVWRPENQESQWCKSRLRACEDWCPAEAFCWIQAIKGLEDTAPTLGRAAYFIESSNSNADLTWKYFQWHTQKYGLIWASYDSQIKTKYHYRVVFIQVKNMKMQDVTIAEKLRWCETRLPEMRKPSPL